ncbi:MAG TPA: acyl-CoA dehydrogenase family protein [Bryobacterales bacterium]|jgi:alkylation response protein AidB-like acyl-CoA dehydrogenase|nr:acyl-CoA dehydrogenase family protein [Bryobacterales bacterium]
MATIATAASRAKGGSFLIESVSPDQIFTPEDFTEEQRQIAATTDEFVNNEILPQVEALEHQEPGLTRSLLRKAGELGLLAVGVPEKFGGLEMDNVTALLVAEHIAKYASFSSTFGAHSTIGTLPIVYFGTEEQKRKYLPKLASGEWMGAYCLSEPHAGSDALAARTRADLDPTGKVYLLNGEKMWITNGNWADLFTVFAKVGGEKFTAFLVERSFPGVRSGPEEKKMGIKGSSTCPVILENAQVPAENLLGEIGRGHIIAFNILNLGRLKLGAGCVGGAKRVLSISIRYAKDRKAFGKPICEFGLIQHKLAEMAIRTYVAETLVYRTGGLIDAQLAEFSWEQPGAEKTALKAVEEFAVECSVVKVYASEILDYIVDEGVQIHGGYGYHQDYAVERAYRDSRINRIFEGTNEINRLLISGMLLKRAVKGQLELMPAAQALMNEVLSGSSLSEPPGDGSLAAEKQIAANAKKIALLSAGAAFQRFLTDLENQQEVLAGISDMIMEAYAMESAVLRAEKIINGGAAGVSGENVSDMAVVFVRDAMNRVESAARAVLAASAEGDALRAQLAILRRLARFEPVNSIALRQRIARRLIAAEKYALS